jgi:hypothetical protein
MRIQYTLPGMQFGKVNDLAAEGVLTASSFTSRLRRLKKAAALDWRSLLRLDRVRPHAGVIGPPPKPGSLDVIDLASERHRWRNLLSRPAGTADPSVRQMMALLQSYQALEDAIVARHLTETRG